MPSAGSTGLCAVLSGEFSVSKTAPLGVGALMHAAASISVAGEDPAWIPPSRRVRKDRFRVQRGGKIGGEKTLFRRSLLQRDVGANVE